MLRRRVYKAKGFRTTHTAKIENKFKYYFHPLMCISKRRHAYEG